MFGARRDTERLINFKANKSSLFSNKLNGRLYVAGVSGSLERHTERLQNERRYQAMEQLYEQQIEIKVTQDHAQLKNLEHEWEERKRIRILKNGAATIVQKIARGYIFRRNAHATNKIIHTIKLMISMRAMIAATLALKIIKNFLRNKVLYRVRQRRCKFVRNIWRNIRGINIFYLVLINTKINYYIYQSILLNN